MCYNHSELHETFGGRWNRMDAEQKARGMRLKYYRKQEKLTLQQLSERTGLSPGFLSKIENGVGNPSVSNIQKISYALGITVNELMMPAAEEQPEDDARQGESFVVYGQGRKLLYNFADTVCFESVYEDNPHFKVNILTLQGNTGQSYCSTHSYDEFGLVAQGVLSIQLGDGDPLELHAGDCIMVRAHTKHTVSAKSAEACVSHWIEISN